ncbi:(p)ppGpp synthetase [candidate division BRC1 bacterium HGW-BRC1-1]|nr:MAG: (p)ppGpp synthetase [candidate division BRC1 bacterium HGW-BRC1-1]
MISETIDINVTNDAVSYILGESRAKYTDDDRSMITRAYEFARLHHTGQVRASGDPYLLHLVETAHILVSLRMDALTIAAGLLHDTIEDCSVTHAQLAEEFGTPLADLVEGVTKISSLHFGSRREQHVESLRKMILAMASDIRVIIIKLADRLHNLHTLRFLSVERQKKIARDTMEIYAPLANRLGMTRIKGELEDLSMFYLYPGPYREIANRVAMRRTEREQIVQTAIETLRHELLRHNVEAEIVGRPKHLWSIYSKMEKQNLPFEEIFDLMAIRVICRDVAQCYDILGVVHSMWKPIQGRFKDYIALPKENGYQSLHTTVMGPDGERLEIQVRSAEMHKFAEEGIAAHWKYKEGHKGKHDLEEKLQWLRRLTDWLKDVRPGEFMDALQQDVFADTVFCFTPRGDVIELPSGSTPLDFAYYIHSNVGETCVGAKVNKKIVSLRATLQNGDAVEIITSKTGHPSADWLDIVRTSRARTKIRHWVKTRHFDENVERGRDLMAKALRARSLPLEWDDINARLAPLIKAFKATSVEDLYAEIGFGGVMPMSVVQRAYPESDPAPKIQPKKGSRKKPASQGVVVEGITNAMLRYAMCCSPVPGDPIVGFVTIGRGVTIHHRDCPNLHHSASHKDGEAKMLEAQWDVQHLPLRRVALRIDCFDRAGLLADITSIFTQMNIFILESKTKSKGDAATLKFLIEVKSVEQLNALFAQLRTVKGVNNLGRSSRSDVA